MITYILIGAVGLLIAVCHALTAFSPRRVSSVSTAAGLALHVVLFILLICASVTMEVAVAAFLGSVTLYSVLSAIAYARVCRRAQAQTQEEEGERV